MKNRIPFDTLEYMETLKKSGMSQEEAEAITKTMAKALSEVINDQELATKTDIKELKIDIKELELKLKGFIVKALSTGVGLLIAFQTLFHFFGCKL
ncbi:MAG TPA: hypothetical protein VHZ50_03580 [Puia sp.]|jgi:hypothetical protein|nr:hypothetical protein [Puia sp.]